MRKIFHATFMVLIAGFGIAGAQNLGPLAASKGIHLGAAITFPTGTSLAPYDSTVSQQFNTTVCENAMKYGTIEATRNKFTWPAADAIVSFAATHGLYMRGHNLCWYQQAGYLANLSTTTTPRDTFLAIMHNHDDSVVTRYKGKIYEWDVVNEAIDQTQSDGQRRSFLYTLNGNSPSYIDSEFVWTHQLDPNANLVYNDYDAEGTATGAGVIAKSNFVYALVSGLVSRGIPINGVGWQCHLTQFDTNGMDTNMTRLGALGLTVSITEMDDPISSATDTGQLSLQKSNYQAMMTMCLRHPNCKTFITWGVNDNQSWLGAAKAPLLYTGTTTITMKPAYYGVQTALLAAASNPLPPTTSGGGGSTPIWQVNSARPGVLQQAQYRGLIQNGVPQFSVHGVLFDLQGRQLPALALPKAISK
jgi:endo-1,4-beta-xylanase